MPTIAQLKADLKARGIKGVAGKNKTELLAMLEGRPVPARSKAPVVINPKGASHLATALNRLLGRGTGGAPPMSDALSKLREVEAATKGRNEAKAAATTYQKKDVGYVMSDDIWDRLTRLTKANPDKSFLTMKKDSPNSESSIELYCDIFQLHVPDSDSTIRSHLPFSPTYFFWEKDRREIVASNMSKIPSHVKTERVAKEVERRRKEGEDVLRISRFK